MDIAIAGDTKAVIFEPSASWNFKDGFVEGPDILT